MDLNLDHYSLTDLLKLFKLSENFTASEFKDAKRIVHALHPDKWTSSKQTDKINYYLFFTKAYQLLESVNQFKHKIEENIDAHLSFEQIIDDMADSDKQQIINSLSVNSNFNKDFNALFDTYYIKEEVSGYGDWLKSNEDLNVSYEDRKRHSRAIVVNQIDGAPQDTYSDLKNAYTVNSVLGVSEEDYSQQYTNLQQLKQVRDTQNLTPLNKEEANQYFANQEVEDNKVATERAFRFVKQTEQNKIQQKSFWSHLLTLKNE
jgi:hypothetical protein